MEYYLTPAATLYKIEIDEAVAIVDHQIQKGFIPWLIPKIAMEPIGEGIFHQFDLPIFFVTEDDLGKDVDLRNWYVVTHRTLLVPTATISCPPDFNTILPRPWYSDDNILAPATNIYGSNRDIAIDIPKKVSIPEASEFEYPIIEFPQCFEEYNNTPYEQTEYYQIKKRSSDWIGVYYGYNSSYRCIIIRIEKILKQTSINTPHGVASTIIHELCHALLDCNSLGLKFKSSVSKGIVDLISYYMEEAMANLFAFRAIRSRSFNKRYLDYIYGFMLTQPFPYALGGELAATQNLSDFTIHNYISKWYKAKCCNLWIDDWKTWLIQIRAMNFNVNDVKKQYETLFSK